jgi:hypothetical protein
MVMRGHQTISQDIHMLERAVFDYGRLVITSKWEKMEKLDMEL